MRPVNKGADPPYTTITTFTFAGANATAIKSLLNIPSATNVPIDPDCLGLWLLKVKGLPPVHGTQVQLNAMTPKKMADKVGLIYKTASVPLTTRIGAFCSFCETSLPGLLEVEHCVPKAPYPTFSVSWNNFLLACSPCNNAKSNDPSRAVALPWTGVPAPTEAQYYTAIRTNHYIWPDLNSQSYRAMPLQLQFFDTGTGLWKNMADNYAYNYNNELISVDLATRTVVARIYAPLSPAYQDVRVQVLVTAAAGQPRAQETIDNVDLNNPGNADSTYDRRLVNRTVAWFNCLKYLKLVALAPDPVTRQNYLNFLEMASALTGFYSVWVQIVDNYDTPTARTFVADTNKAMYFPGTNATNVP